VIVMRTKRFAIVAAAVAAVVAVGAVVALAAGGGSWNAGWGMMGGRYVYRPAQPTQVHTLTAARADARQFASRLGLRVDEVMQFERNFYAKLVDSNGNGATEVLVDPSTGVVSIEYGPAMMWNTRYGMGRSAGSIMGSYGRGMMRGQGYGGMMRGQGYGGMIGGRSGGSSSTGGYGPGMMGGSGDGPGMMGGSGSTGGSSTAPSTTTKVSLAQAHALAQRWLDRNEPGVQVESGGDAFPGYYTLETLNGGKITGMISVNASTGAVWPHWWHGAFIAKS
jgi:hypothetical protein